MAKKDENDFSEKTKDTLSKRANHLCSNPECRDATSGPHTDEARSINIGEAAHICGARPKSARYDANMTPKQRSDIYNGIWLCRTCAKLIDSDESKYAIEKLLEWKEHHEQSVLKSNKQKAAKEILVKGGGIGQIINNAGPGIGEDIVQEEAGSGQTIVVEGKGIGEIITNTGPGIGKRITKSGNGVASEVKVNVNEPVNFVVGLHVSAGTYNCSNCGYQYAGSQVIQGFAGNSMPSSSVNCPKCGTSN